ncbi:hypothetical protein ABW20_dc0102685 [Dactylellina cionopaga]|nr:hypothetical protein ABW20_dc0102685 [Dactylellina cionopaga]
MHGLTLLPDEILLQILGDQSQPEITAAFPDLSLLPVPPDRLRPTGCHGGPMAILSKADLRNLSSTCKRLYDITYPFLSRDRISLELSRGIVIFSFLRRLLADETFAESVKHLRVGWDGTYAYTPAIWENQLPMPTTPESERWTEAELARLQHLNVLHQVKPNWRIRIESTPTVLPEILVIPILYLLPNLENLWIQDHNAYTGQWMHNSFFAKYVQRLVPDRKSQLKPERLFKSLPSGLSNLSVVRINGGNIFDHEKGYKVAFLRAKHIYPVFLLPKIEEIHLLQFGGSFASLDRFKKAGLTSAVAAVSLTEYSGFEDSLMSLLDFCPKLKDLQFTSERVGATRAGILKHWMKNLDRVFVDTPDWSWEYDREFGRDVGLED